MSMLTLWALILFIVSKGHTEVRSTSVGISAGQLLPKGDSPLIQGPRALHRTSHDLQYHRPNSVLRQ